MYLKCTPSNFKVNKDLRCRIITWIYLDFIIYFELFLQGNMDLWCRMITNICKQFVRYFTIVTSLPPPSIMAEGGRFGGGGVRGDRSLTYFYFSYPPPLSKCKNSRLRLLTLGGSTLAISMTPAVKFRGGKIAIYIFGTPPCLQLT